MKRLACLRARTLLFLLNSACLTACLGGDATPLDAPSSDGLALQSQTLSHAGTQTCTIRVGSGGTTREYTAELGEGEMRVFGAVPASEFIRATSGPCHFRVYNGQAMTGESVVLGTNLNTRIRAGVDGLTRKDKGGGQTWSVRSILMVLRPSTCRVRLGANGVRMDYFADYVTPLPASDRVDAFVGGDCAAELHAGLDFGASDASNRKKLLHPSAASASTYDPGFVARSLAIWDNQNVCPQEAQDAGRCLPQVTLAESVFASGPADADDDGLDDALENELAHAFAPVHYNHSSENGTRAQIYVAADGTPVTEPATLFQVRPYGASGISIQYMRLWLRDVWDSPTCPGHRGDSQRHTLYLSTSAESAAGHGRFWWVSGTDGGIQSDLRWSQGDGSVRGAHFVRVAGELGPARHLAIYFSKGKHHEYADSGWSGQPDKECVADRAHVDGRGHQHEPPYPMRLASLSAPPGAGDASDVGNVGSRAHPFFDDLTPYGFPGECVWGCGNFYDANPVDRGFE